MLYFNSTNGFNKVFVPDSLESGGFIRKKSVRLLNYLPGQEALECPCDE